MRLLIYLIINSLAVAGGAYLLPGVHLAGVKATVMTAIVLGLLNTFLKPILVFLTLPATILTLGLFLFVINAAIIWLTAKMVPGFRVDGLGWALLFSLVVTIISSFLNLIT